MPTLIEAVKAQGLEGLVAKRRNSRYEGGQRSGAWQKMRVNRGQEFVIGGYTVGGRTFDSLIFGYYQDGQFIYAARTRNGFTPLPMAQANAGGASSSFWSGLGTITFVTQNSLFCVMTRSRRM